MRTEEILEQLRELVFDHEFYIDNYYGTCNDCRAEEKWNDEDKKFRITHSKGCFVFQLRRILTAFFTFLSVLY